MDVFATCLTNVAFNCVLLACFIPCMVINVSDIWLLMVWKDLTSPISLSLVPLRQDPSSDQSQTAPPHRANGTEEFQQRCKQRQGDTQTQL